MRRAAVVLLLTVHAGLLAWQAYRYSPTIDEPGHLVAGISHWKFGRFDLYRVNPPLVRLVAALPMLAVDPKTDWSAFSEAPYARPEFPIGTTFANANGLDTFWYFTLARWACIPFSLIGGWYCYRWANDLYGKDSGFRIQDSGNVATPPLSKGGAGGVAWNEDSGFGIQDSGRGAPEAACADPLSSRTNSTSTIDDRQSPPGDRRSSIRDPRPSHAPGLMALALWCFCPNILGNGTLITPDVAAASLGIAAGYYFWHWLRDATWANTLRAGFVLGLAELTKSSLIVLFALWPALWLVWIICRQDKRPGAGTEGAENVREDSGFGIRDSGNIATSPLSKGGAGGGARNDASGFRIQDSGKIATPPLSKGGLGGVACNEDSGFWIQDSGNALSSGSPPSDHHGSRTAIHDPRPSNFNFRSATQLAASLALALYLLNLGYGFEQSFQRLDSFRFISRALGGAGAHEKPGNRFAETWVGSIPVPLPANYLRGIDVQKYDFEKGKWSYLRGEQKMGGWWYYYLYAMGVKMPAGTLFLIALTGVLKSIGIFRQAHARRVGRRRSRAALASGSDAPPCVSRDLPAAFPDSILSAQSTILDEFILLAPAFILIALVSSQTGFNRYLRYVVPAFPFLYVWISQLAIDAAGARNRCATVVPRSSESAFAFTPQPAARPLDRSPGV